MMHRQFPETEKHLQPPYEAAFRQGEQIGRLLGRLIRADIEKLELTESLEIAEERIDLITPYAIKRVKRLLSSGHHAEHADGLLDSDPLTGLYNHRAWMEMLTDRTEIEPGDFGILFIDFNSFKNVNDEVSHTAGDELLRRSAAVLKEQLRHNAENHTADMPARLAQHLRYSDIEYYFPGRVGGDEFAVLCDLEPRGEGEQLTPRERLEAICARISQALEELIDSEFPGLRPLGFGYSIGGSVWREGMNAIEMIDEAEEEMKADKDLNRFRHLPRPERAELLTSEAQRIIDILRRGGIRIPEIPTD